jgi:uncharacterized protein DUF3300
MSSRSKYVGAPITALLVALFLVSPPAMFSQQEQTAPLFSPSQLDDLVAPVALYPDPLLTQVLVACTYPLEIVEASQWLARNPNLTGTMLTSAAQEQMWDPSIQALVVFRDLVKRLSEDITWTTNLGNAFLAQQADVMDAVQRMRVRAQQGAKLSSTPQQTVATTVEGGQTAITIQPSQPAVIYVPVYDPLWVWGPYIYYPYPRWHYPLRPVIGIVIFSPPIIITNFFPGPWIGWSAWGWYPMWSTRVVIVNHAFINRYSFRPFPPNGGRSAVWIHDGFHRQGVPYPNRRLTEQYRPNLRENLGRRPSVEARPAPGAVPGARERMGNREIPANSPNRNRGAFGGIENGEEAKKHAERGHSSIEGTPPNRGTQPDHGGHRSHPSRNPTHR